MKKYYVTVNGNRYEVEVEEAKEDFNGPSKVLNSSSNREGNYKPSPMQVPKPVISKEKILNNDIKEGEKINCPMPGTILNINVKEGDNIKKGDLLFILEAMKMENEIVSPISGTVISISVSKGQSVNTGDILAIIK
ncbi:Biotin carboxyl carrier protein [Clostridium sp. USBA 49]|jgi:biotin carboxyl carrier protein|uniref:biotin/lipoyl-containing protein n=1 Tax=Clostridium TaxID=1485 RepID=UPI00099A5635|nr:MULTISPECIES: biotin/lipoyl-containing protein [Clostridium]SKA85845.1 Biotin carboxyl carrier protein [Clostridium sp. USBA 49]